MEKIAVNIGVGREQPVHPEEINRTDRLIQNK